MKQNSILWLFIAMMGGILMLSHLAQSGQPNQQIVPVSFNTQNPP